MTLVLCVILVALVFEYINGFHDTANAIATSVSTKVLTPAQAIVLSTVCNLIGALIGVAVAKTVGKGLVDANFVTATALLFALAGAIIWNLLTWWLGLPSSSSHALFGGLCGAVLAASHGNWSSIIWYKHTAIDPVTQKVVELSFVKSTGLWPKVLFPMVAAPVCGFLIGFLIMGLLYVLLRNWRPHVVNAVFGKMQLLSAAWMSITHGTNDAQKTMGIMALTLFTATTKGDAFAHLPSWLSFLALPKFEIPFWIKIACGLTMAAGTAAGGWRIIKTLGSHMVKLQPVHGFSAQTTAALVIETASHWGIPLSTTHVISSSIMGVGASKRFKAVKWSVAERMAWAWIMTLPVTAGISYSLLWICQKAGLAD
jgi:inorganic phosphate transporter, PiT family